MAAAVRDVEAASGTGHWYKAGQGLVEVLWVYVHDRTGTHRDEYFFTTDVRMSVQEVIETYVGRWNEETTFQEMRLVSGIGDDARVEADDGPASGAVPIRAVHGSGLPVQPVAQAVRPGTGDPGGGQAGRDLLRCDHSRKALAVAGVGFCNPRLQAGLCKTRTPLPLPAAPGSCSCCLSPKMVKSRTQARTAL